VSPWRLRLLASIAESGMPTDWARYECGELQKAGLIERPPMGVWLSYMAPPESRWSITPAGQSYLDGNPAK
jgi:hypothetical protein